MCEPHAIKDIPEMIGTLGGVWETTIGSGLRGKTVDTPGAPWDMWASHLLDSGNTSQSPEITITYPRELCLDLFHELTSNVQTSVGAVQRFWLEPHSCVVAVDTRVNCEQNHYDETEKVITCHQSLCPYHRFRTRARQDGEGQAHKNHLKEGQDLALE